MLMHSAPAYTAYDNMLVPIQTPRASSLIARLTHKPVPFISLELHNLYGFRAEQIKCVRVKVDREQGDILIESFPWVTDLTITLVNTPSLTTIATALSQFPNTRNLTIIITPEAPNSKKHRAVRSSLSLQKLTAILPHVRVFELSGWNDEICEWICKTSSGISFMDIKEYQHTSATPKQTKLLQTILDNNKEMVIFTLATFYQVQLNFSSLPKMSRLRVCVAEKGAIVAPPAVATIPETQTCMVTLMKPRVMQESTKPGHPSKQIDHAVALRCGSEWSVEQIIVSRCQDCIPLIDYLPTAVLTYPNI